MRASHFAKPLNQRPRADRSRDPVRPSATTGLRDLQTAPALEDFFKPRPRAELSTLRKPWGW